MSKSLILLLIILNSAFAQTSDSLDKQKLYILSGIGATAFIVSQAIQYDVYWKNSSNFSLMDRKTEYNDALLADKAGHFFAGYAISKITSKLFEWTGVNKELSLWVGTGISLFHQSYIEVNDGFSKGEVFLGFSVGDMIADIGGASIPILQHYYPSLNTINFKISYYKSNNFDKVGYDYLINDYESTYHWVVIDLVKIVTQSEKDTFLNLALGHSVKNIDRLGSGYHEFYISLDLNWDYLNQFEVVKSNFYLQLLVEFLSKYKVPLPSIRIAPSLQYYNFR